METGNSQSTVPTTPFRHHIVRTRSQEQLAELLFHHSRMRRDVQPRYSQSIYTETLLLMLQVLDEQPASQTLTAPLHFSIICGINAVVQLNAIQIEAESLLPFDDSLQRAKRIQLRSLDIAGIQVLVSFFKRDMLLYSLRIALGAQCCPSHSDKRSACAHNINTRIYKADFMLAQVIHY